MSYSIKKGYVIGITILLLAIVATLAYVIYSLSDRTDSTIDTVTNTNTVSNTNNAEEPDGGFGPEVNRPAPTNTSRALTYQNAVTQYEGRRIQINNCQATPANVTYKNGTTIMLDNRSADPVEIRLDNQTYRMWGYEFRLVTLRRSNLPYTISMDCFHLEQPQYNIALIKLQQ